MVATACKSGKLARVCVSFVTHVGSEGAENPGEALNGSVTVATTGGKSYLTIPSEGVGTESTSGEPASFSEVSTVAR